MSKTTQAQLERLLRQTQFSGEETVPDEALEVYQTRPANTQTKGYQAPAPNAEYGIVSPLTEVSRVTTPVTITSGAFSVTVDVATQITMTDANGTTFVFNYAAPE